MKAGSYLIAAGGTAGHIHPALAVARGLREREPGCRILFAGTARGMESDVVPREGFAFSAIRAMGFPSRPSLRMARALVEYQAGKRESRELVRTFRPDVAIGTGGYVCGPVLSAAAAAGVPLVLHEQNAFPGRANRFLSRKAAVVCVSFPDSAASFPRGTRIEVTGNPVRPPFFATSRDEGRSALGLAPGQRLVLVMGGSLGARTLNQAVADIAPMLARDPAFASIRLLLSTGRDHFASLAGPLSAYPAIETRDFIRDPHLAMAAADLVICRAGAVTCAELAATGRPSVLVPYPHAAQDHQTINARAMERAGAALLVPDAEFGADRMAGTLRDLLADPDRFERMGHAARTLARTDSVDRIVDLVLEAAHGA